ncbi:hypothetical protein DYU05_06520 [Mucilaginibacter terrenus]|uniref:Uncharacterized protein n=1 Tax=Mucilaginibacter terrenus TaxID=2482727 RepID=A0A3E2NWA9_9SPHI|nr:hypothetical protein [Mucilaginibacter terrenus]RFZ85249.1 hypothetical protein DYU05_06520 [Mucilaginibacter terrenus]
MKTQIFRKMNSELTNWVIRLHQIGYTDDFLPLNPREVQCVQNGESFLIKDLRVNLIDCNFDQLTNTYQYIHTIDTGIGHRGLLITNGILGLVN